MRRSYKAVSVRPASGGWQVWLDEQPLKTPVGQVLNCPAEALAKAIAYEWEAQEKVINPRTMPFTQLAFTAVDRVEVQRSEIIQSILAYIDTDLLCYRVSEPPELVQKQKEVWDPLLEWMRQRYDIHFSVTYGLKHQSQPSVHWDRLGKILETKDALHLTVLQLSVHASGSLVLGLALADGAFQAEQIFEASALDELFQAEKWGIDAEAQQRRTELLTELQHMQRFLELLGK